MKQELFLLALEISEEINKIISLKEKCVPNYIGTNNQAPFLKAACNEELENLKKKLLSIEKQIQKYAMKEIPTWMKKD